MSENKKVKRIDMETLDRADKKVRTKVIRKAAIVAIIVVLASAAGWGTHRIATGGVLSTKFTVNRMTCPGCVTRINEAVSKIPGVMECAVNLAAYEAVVTFRDRETDSGAIEKTISDLGFATELDGEFTPSGKGIGKKVSATVNGRPIFQNDVGLPLFPEEKNNGVSDPAAVFFDNVGRYLLVQTANKNNVFARPHEIKREIDRIRTEKGLSVEEMKVLVIGNCGSIDKYTQIIAQRIGIRKLVEKHVSSGPQGSGKTKRKTMEWLATVFRDSEVKILDSDLKKELEKVAGKDEWNTFWPRMISRDTELKRVLL